MNVTCLFLVTFLVVHHFNGSTFVYVRHVSLRRTHQRSIAILRILFVCWVVVLSSARQHVVPILISIHILVVCGFLVNMVYFHKLASLFGLYHATKLEKFILFVLIPDLHQLFLCIERGNISANLQIGCSVLYVYSLSLTKQLILLMINVIGFLGAYLSYFKRNLVLLDLLFNVQNLGRLWPILINVSQVSLWLRSTLVHGLILYFWQQVRCHRKSTHRRVTLELLLSLDHMYVLLWRRRRRLVFFSIWNSLFDCRHCLSDIHGFVA